MIACFSRLAGLVLALAAGAALAAPPQVYDDPGVLVLGRISDDPKSHYEQLKPLLDYVVPRMADVGIREGRILMARDAQQMASYLRRGRVDWVTETAGTGMLLQARANAAPLLLTERDGVQHYHSVFFARRDSGIDGLGDLKGRRLAFQLPSSTSAYFVPAGALLAEGLQLEILLSPQDRMQSEAVGYLFARSELNISTWVHKGLVDVGVMSNLDWGNPQRMPAAFRDDLVVFARSADYPRAIELVRGDLEAPVLARLREVLIQAARDPDAGDALLRFFKTTRFLPLDDASLQALGRIGRDVERVRAEVE
ncbi:phosphate/phosphite/phosphonate ABC transporter substrate-binding protein [Lysobacter sp. A3-1-A15]|uniref:phosphate/phosphite/phosphonate ABC transporter substrate-binding protein n=1 Tax=Novilysobacter viscosus TaxID=3098602 RepID=UPI003983505F